MNLRKIFLAAAISVSAFSYMSGQRMAVLSDVHVTPGNANESQLRLAVDEINKGKYDFVVMNGDLGNEGSDIELNNVKSILDGIKAPLFVLPGDQPNSTLSSSSVSIAVHT